MDYRALKGRDFLTLLDFTPDEIAALLALAAELKAKKEGRRAPRRAAGQKHRADL